MSLMHLLVEKGGRLTALEMKSSETPDLDI